MAYDYEDACPHCSAAHEALLDQLVETRVELEELKDLVALLIEASDEHEDRLDLHSEELDALYEEDEEFESEDDEDE